VIAKKLAAAYDVLPGEAAHNLIIPEQHTRTETEAVRGTMVLENAGNIRDYYDFGNQLSCQGPSGRYFRARHKRMGFDRIVRVIDIPHAPRMIVNFKRELSILKTLDHPNVIKLYETFEDGVNVFLVMEMCTGCDLLEGIISVGNFAETQAAFLMRQIFSVVNYLHKSSIIHRNINSDTFTFSNPGPIDNNTLKLNDMSRAKVTSKGEETMSMLGSSLFSAPEAWTAKYSTAIDMWICGVLAYCLLCGYLPFDGQHHPDVVERIRRADYDFFEYDWNSISGDAQDLVKSLIRVYPHQRLDAEQALHHDWISLGAPRANKSSFGAPYFNKLCCGPRRVKGFKQMVHRIIKGTLDETMVQALQEIFTSLDRKGTGKVGLAEFEDAAADANICFPPSILRMIEDIDQHGDGTVEHAKFMALAVDNTRRLTDDLLWNTFQSFEMDKDGYIPRKDVQTVVGNPAITALTEVQADTLKEMFDKVDQHGGYINFDEFRDVMLQIL